MKVVPMKWKKYAVIYIFIYLLGLWLLPWRYYGELHNKDVKGVTTYDSIKEFKAANIFDGKLKICLRAIVDGKENELFIEKNIEDLMLMRKSQAHYNSEIDLDRSDYQKKCSKLEESFSLFVYDSRSLSHLSDKQIILDYPHIDNSLNHFIVSRTVPNESFIEIKYGRGFALYFSDSNPLPDGGRLLLFYIENPYHQEYNVSWHRYAITLGIDFITMPIQVLLLAQYLGGGAS